MLSGFPRPWFSLYAKSRHIASPIGHLTGPSFPHRLTRNTPTGSSRPLSPTLPLPGPLNIPTFVSRLKSVFCVKGLSLWSHMVCHALRPPPSAVGRMVGGEVFRAEGSHSPGIGKVVGTCTSTRVLATDGVLGMWRGLSQRHIGHLILGWARDIQVRQDWRTSL